MTGELDDPVLGAEIDAHAIGRAIGARELAPGLGCAHIAVRQARRHLARRGLLEWVNEHNVGECHRKNRPMPGHSAAKVNRRKADAF